MTKLLFDQNISYRIVKILEVHFPDCKHVSQIDLHDSKDFQIWEYAKKENFTIVTFDSDFYDLSLIRGFPPKIVWLRVGNLLTKELAQIIIKNKVAIQDLQTGNDFQKVACLEID